ncbi:unnamed protein product [Adineta steineri]|uniref:Uncharacterized protein n=1 Tax=Adineta steineri TaxID=433720 RepID=A0A814XRA7_9BILA|nr:unnamed protein product [Adineta steineri]CAF3959596.1 unnamed protein product [Adineta steineri]
MAKKSEKETRFSLVEVANKIEESRVFWNRSQSLPEKPVVPQEKPVVPQEKTVEPVLQKPKLPHYTPLDSIMYPLMYAIRCKSWVKARKLCHELILCDPEQKLYQGLYIRLVQLTNLIDQQNYSRNSRASSRSRTTITESDM